MLCVFLFLLFLLSGAAVSSEMVRSVLVEVGSNGSDDDVAAKLCTTASEDDKRKCCWTPTLSRVFSNDWSRNDDEEWKGWWHLGDCHKFRVVRRRLKVPTQLCGKFHLTIRWTTT